MARNLEIAPADTEKWYFRIAMNWFIKKYSGGKNSKIIHEEMMDCGNPIFHYFIRLKNKICEKINGETWQSDNINSTSEFFLWILYKDTAYRQIFFWALKQILEDKDKLLKLIEEYYSEPEDWYVNLWHESKERTRKQRENKEIPEANLSISETYFVPSIQTKRQKEIEELEKERKKIGVG